MNIFDTIKKIFGIKTKKNTKKTIKNENIELNKEFKKEDSQTLVNLVKKNNYENKIEKNIKEKEFDKDIIYFEDLWDYINPKENTQAYHLLSVIGFDEWVDMEEIRKRIKHMFYIEYKNEKSLYPYLKTLTDVGLLETTSIGGKRKWKKKELIIKLTPKQKIKIELKEKLKELEKYK